MDDQRATIPYGEWPSPISAAGVGAARLRLGHPLIGPGGVWWEETRPHEDGRTTVVHLPDGASGGPRDLLSPPWCARTRVHEYGGRAYLPVPGGAGQALVFANMGDQRLYLADPGGAAPRPLTPEPGVPAGWRYADLVPAPGGADVLCVRESHRPGGGVARAIVAVPLDGGAARRPDAVRELVTGDFLAAPRPSPDGRRLAWIAWRRPAMPWDGTELMVADLDRRGGIAGVRSLKGGPAESVLAPEWRDDEHLYAVSDESGWWNLYLIDRRDGSCRPVAPAEEEFAGPLWTLGDAPYGLLADGRLLVVRGRGARRLAVCDPATGRLHDVDTPYTDWQHAISTTGSAAVGIAAAPAEPPSVVRVEIGAGGAVTGRARPLRREFQETPDPAYLPVPEPRELTGPAGERVHAYFYPPANPRAKGPEGRPPPCLLWVHGGPTSQVTGVLELEKAYFTSRGLAILDVNYGGSAGYGRAYRQRLRGNWGLVDVADVQAAARALAAGGEVDGARLAVRGRSAGGWTVLSAMTRRQVFAAGVSYFGIGELLGFSREVHDFEAHYLQGLVGAPPSRPARYVERAPLTHAGEIRCPVLMLHGKADPVVPAKQAEMFAGALLRNGVPHALIEFPDESHGFRKVESWTVSLQAELSFYGQVLGFTPPGVPALALK